MHSRTIPTNADFFFACKFCEILSCLFHSEFTVRLVSTLWFRGRFA
jgi:hypothetical protein